MPRVLTVHLSSFLFRSPPLSDVVRVLVPDHHDTVQSAWIVPIQTVFFHKSHGSHPAFKAWKFHAFRWFPTEKEQPLKKRGAGECHRDF